MRIKTALTAGIGLVLMAGVAAAEGPRVYPHHTSENFCPAGLQPVTMNGAICCGVPNQSMTYQSMMSHPVRKKVHRARYNAPKADCPIGQKGCSYDR